ncbi:hypothetical protein CGLO_11844 [Colletotrichum gloeosporioides Cg-14]|uniref:Uncharacterized protein n=1 Tax=Colletotrichum gloeosporioides (strain Cg-14) TaxID=1237896 RepID=T0JZL1_COLGC|nr:hypothetical protein CGLO_11844 [Colletotrichum gloeosporioides Cg-14]
MEAQIVGQSPTPCRPFFDPVRDALFVNETKGAENYQQTQTNGDESWRPDSSKDSPDTEYQHQAPSKKKKKSTSEYGQQVFQFLSISHPKEARLFRTKIRSHAAQNPNAREKRVAGLKANLPKRLAPDFKAEGSLPNSAGCDEDTLQSKETTWRILRPQMVASIQSSPDEKLNENQYEKHTSKIGVLRDCFRQPAPRPVDLPFNENLVPDGSLSSKLPRQFDAASPKRLNSSQQNNLHKTWQAAEVRFRGYDKYEPDCEITEEDQEERMAGRFRRGA